MMKKSDTKTKKGIITQKNRKKKNKTSTTIMPLVPW